MDKDIEKVIFEMKTDAAKFLTKRDIVKETTDILYEMQGERFYRRKTIWLSFILLLLICNLTQAFLLINSRRLMTTQPPEKSSVIVFAPPEISTQTVLPLKDVGKKTETPITTGTAFTNEIIVKEGMNSFIELYELFETLSPRITLQKGDSYEEV